MADYRPQYSNLPAKDPGQTADYFNNYFKTRRNIDVNLYDAAVALFQKQTKDRAAAETIASTLIAATLEQEIDFKDLLDKFSKMSLDDVNRYMVTVLNLNRKNSSYIGYKSDTSNTGTYISRSILP
jgi:hypothetical protein